MRQLFLWTLFLLAAGVLPSLAVETPLKERQNFYRAREALLHDGWRPVITFQKDFKHTEASGGEDHFWTLAKPFWRHGYKEVVSCSGMEANFCNFHYRRKARCLFVA